MCAPCSHRDSFELCFYSAGVRGQKGPTVSERIRSPTELTGDPTERVKLHADIWPDQPDVPAIFHYFRMARD